MAGFSDVQPITELSFQSTGLPLPRREGVPSVDVNDSLSFGF